MTTKKIHLDQDVNFPSCILIFDNFQLSKIQFFMGSEMLTSQTQLKLENCLLGQAIEGKSPPADAQCKGKCITLSAIDRKRGKMLIHLFKAFKIINVKTETKLLSALSVYNELTFQELKNYDIKADALKADAFQSNDIQDKTVSLKTPLLEEKIENQSNACTIL